MLNTQSVNKAVFFSLIAALIWIAIAYFTNYIGAFLINHFENSNLQAPFILDSTYIYTAKIFLTLLVVTSGYSWLLLEKEKLSKPSFLLACWIVIPFIAVFLPSILINGNQWYHTHFLLITFLAAVYVLNHTSMEKSIGLELLWWMGAILFIVKEYSYFSNSFYFSQAVDSSYIVLIPLVMAVLLNFLVLVIFPRWFLSIQNAIK